MKAGTWMFLSCKLRYRYCSFECHLQQYLIWSESIQPQQLRARIPVVYLLQEATLFEYLVVRCQQYNIDHAFTYCVHYFISDELKILRITFVCSW